MSAVTSEPAPSHAAQRARRPASAAFRTILTHVRSDAPDLPRLRTAAALARKFDATLFGLGAEMIPPLGASDPMGLMQGQWYVEMRNQLTANLEQAQQLFEAETQDIKRHWAWIEDMPAGSLARAARGADLIVVGGCPLGAADRYRGADPAEVALRAGRPVLIAPPQGGALAAESIVVAWKDTREARRALADAMPLLEEAKTVLVLEVCSAEEAELAEARTAAVIAGLKRHDVNATARVVVAPPEKVTRELNAAARELGADLIVAGGYGHSRLGEWLFGGVTRDLLNGPESFVFLSH